MSEYIIEWSGIGGQLARLLNDNVPLVIWPKKIREERQREEVVRCKYCKHTRKSWNGKRPDFVPDGFFCAYWGGHQLWEPDGFCKWGERKSK